MAKIAFTANVKAGGPGGAWFHAVFPRRVTERLGTKAAVRVAGTIDGHKFRSSAFPNGDGTHHIMVNKAMRDATGLGDGDRARFVLDRDVKPRVVRIPPELRAALESSKRAGANFRAMPPSHRKAYVDYILGAKRPETRAKRVQQSVARLGEGKGWWK
jgi:bacteriocin resistance YdeI/OmpD-like protein/uncharacterized protein DUF1905